MDSNPHNNPNSQKKEKIQISVREYKHSSESVVIKPNSINNNPSPQKPQIEIPRRKFEGNQILKSDNPGV